MLNRLQFITFVIPSFFCVAVFSQVETVPFGEGPSALKGFRYHSWKILDEQSVSIQFFQNIDNPTSEQVAKQISSINKQVALPANVSKRLAKSLEYIDLADYGARVCPEDIDITAIQSRKIKTAVASVKQQMKSIASKIRTNGMEDEFMAIAIQIKKECDELNKTTLLDFQIARIKQVQIASKFFDNFIAHTLSTPPISDELNITKEQKAELLVKKKELESELQKKFLALVSKYQDELLNELSATQRKQFEELEIKNGPYWKKRLELRLMVLLRLSRL